MNEKVLQSVNYVECKKCGQVETYDEKDTFWDEKCSGYSRKLIRCPSCGAINVLKYEEDFGFDQNNDKNYFF